MYTQQYQYYSITVIINVVLLYSITVIINVVLL